MPDERKKDRYALRSDTAGWTVLVLWTGSPPSSPGVAQTGLSEKDARHMATLLNARVAPRRQLPIAQIDAAGALIAGAAAPT